MTKQYDELVAALGSLADHCPDNSFEATTAREAADTITRLQNELEGANLMMESLRRFIETGSAGADSAATINPPADPGEDHTASRDQPQSETPALRLVPEKVGNTPTDAFLSMCADMLDEASQRLGGLHDMKVNAGKLRSMLSAAPEAGQ